jgi:predicted RNase H-like HicB family nuclease
MRNYIAIIHKDQDSDFGASFPDFPGCISAGSTLDEAKAMAQEALVGHIEVNREYGDPIPEPMSLEDAMAHEFAEGALAFLVVEGPGEEPFIRANITAPQGILRRIDHYAKAHGLSRSAFMVQAARQAMQRGA